MSSRLRRALAQANPIIFTTVAGLAGFCCYFSMYAFRKPFTAATFEVVPGWLSYGLPVSAGVAIYVGATDLVPEVNREPGIRMAFVFFAGVGAFLLLRMLLPAL